MSYLHLVKSLQHLKEEKKHVDEVLLDSIGLSFARGTIAEISGGPSTGKTSLTLSVLAKLTRRGEVCAIVDSTGGFDPCTASAAGVILENILWVRCGGDIEKSFLAADYIVQAKGFGAIWLNLNCLPERKLQMVPKTYWYRYRTRIKDTPTLFLVTSQKPITGSASHQALVITRESTEWSGTGRYKLLRKLHVKISPRRGFFGPPIETEIEFDYMHE